MTQPSLNYFKTIFENKQKEISKSYLEKLEENTELACFQGDEGDVAQNNLIRSVTDKLSQRDKEQLRKIKAALLRIENGTFGVCEECEEEISAKRLLAIPDCEYCVDCTESMERERKQYRQR